MGDAQFTIAVDGNQIGGTQDAKAIHGAGATQRFTVNGAFNAGTHTVTISFLNDLYGGTESTDRNLYIDSLVVGGAVSSINDALFSAGSVSLTVAMSASSPATPPTSTVPTISTLAAQTPAKVILGSGPDTLALHISEDAYLGDAQFTVAVNGTQIGGVQTATASHAAGASQEFQLLGTFKGASLATVTFLNDAYGGTAATDRNLYVVSSSIDGVVLDRGTLTELSGGPQNLLFQGSPPNAVAAITPVTLHLSEDAYRGDAQFIVSVDGGAATAPQTVTAIHGLGASQAFSIAGVAAGEHDIAVSFVNDLYDGTPSTDRNLYVNGIDVGGVALPATSSALLGDWTVHFTIFAPQ